MRSTIKISSNSALNTILDNYSRLLKVQNQMSTGKRVMNPSDDPLATNAGMRMDTILSKIAQYDRNIAVGDSFLALSDSSIGSVNDMLNSAKSLTIGAASETTTHEMRKVNAVEINNLMQEIVTIANRQDGTRYIFGGTETQNQPFEIVGGRYVHYTGNDEDITVQIDSSSNMAINVTGNAPLGAMNTVMGTDDLSPDINMAVNHSTRLEDLNLGEGVPDGSITVFYSDYPNTGEGLTIDLSGADTLEDIKDIIEKETLLAGQKIAATNTRYLRVDINPNQNGLQIREWDSAVDLPPGSGASTLAAPTAAIEVREVADNTVARDLGIRGIGSIAANATYGVNVNTLTGSDNNPSVSELTLLADLAGYSDAALTITNGALPGAVSISELDDVNGYLNNWRLSGLSEGVNTGDNGELYTTVSYDGTNYTVDIYKSADRLASDRVATGTSTANGTIVMSEVNSSGISGTVGLVYPAVVGSDDLDQTAVFDPTFRGTVSVPAFVESGDANNQLESWHIRGLEKGVSTDANGNFYVEVTTAGADHTVNIYNDPAMNPANLVATGTLTGSDYGTVTLQGVEPTFDGVQGTVEMEYLADVAAADNFSVEATFKTVGDLMNEVGESGTYTSARVSEDGKKIEIVSHLAGGTLNVSRASGSLQRTNDNAGVGATPQLTRMNLPGIIAGENSDRDGNLYASITDDGAAANPRYMVRIYSDSARTQLVASGGTNVAGAATLITLNEENGSGLIGGSVELNYNADDTDIVIDPRGMDLSGREREENIFSTLNDVIDAMNANDVGRLSELLGNFDTDQDRLLMSRAEVGSRMDRLEMLTNRHADESVNFSKIRSERIDLDFASAIIEYQAMQNVFDSSLRTTAQVIQMSLVDYI